MRISGWVLGGFGRRLAVLLLAGVALGGCAAVPSDADNDPLEPVNRVFYGFNDAIDTVILEPVSEFYIAVTPDPVREGVSNFFVNLDYPVVVLNNALQGKFERAASDAGRFVVNSTVGVLGFFDPATGLGLARHDEDFGQTLGVWGAGPGFHLHLPLFGPSSLRDAPALVVDTMTGVLYYLESSIALPLTALRIVDQRAGRRSAFRIRDSAAMDPYLFTRESYRQRREYLIHDGDPPRRPVDDADE